MPSLRQPCGLGGVRVALCSFCLSKPPAACPEEARLLPSVLGQCLQRQPLPLRRAPDPGLLSASPAVTGRGPSLPRSTPASCACRPTPSVPPRPGLRICTLTRTPGHHATVWGGETSHCPGCPHSQSAPGAQGGPSGPSVRAARGEAPACLAWAPECLAPSHLSQLNAKGGGAWVPAQGPAPDPAPESLIHFWFTLPLEAHGPSLSTCGSGERGQWGHVSHRPALGPSTWGRGAVGAARASTRTAPACQPVQGSVPLSTHAHTVPRGRHLVLPFAARETEGRGPVPPARGCLGNGR